MIVKFDWIALLLIVGLLATLTAFFSGLLPYPIGLIAFAALLAFRLMAMQKREC